MAYEQSKKLFEQAIAAIPGGVNSPVRACKSVGVDPLFIDRAKGCEIFDVDENKYIDYVCSWGPMILGHRHPAVEEAVRDVLKRGTSFGAPTDLEIELAEMVIDSVPSIDMVRMVNSGTEATMSAVRLARGYTDRDMIIKFDGCYHGHADALLVEAGSGVATFGIPGSPGIPNSFAEKTLSLPYNDSESFKEAMNTHGDKIACVILEPVAANMGLVLPSTDFLKTLREETEKNGSLLIFDEVITGFRVAFGGAQELYGIMPDLTCLGKVIGGGLPVGAYGGKKEIMEKMAPQGPVYQAGTLSGNPIAMTAGIATLKEISKPGFYEDLDQIAERLADGLKTAADRNNISVSMGRVGSIMGMFFTDREVRNFDDAKTSNLDRFTEYYKGMRGRGIYLAPSQFEVGFVSAAHTPEHIDATIAAANEVFGELNA